MKSLDLVGRGEFVDHGSIDALKPDELFYLRIPSLRTVSDELCAFVARAARRSSQVVVSIPGEEIGDESLLARFLDLGICGFALRLSHDVEKWLKAQGLGQQFAGDRGLIEAFERRRSAFPVDRFLTVEFQVGEDTRILGATITGVHRAGASWVVLNPLGKPSRQRFRQFRDVIEYLKIRNCNRLNVYFPFWGPDMAEWDLKTQNTFSGLETVHIDISNRCSHSCVFCGLYGPDAIEDVKQRSGGVLPEGLKNLMKMEMNPEKCLKIIQSLPWSVQMIQFGGMGDPLMHESAVEILAAARRRGFAIEVLSNMEYLNDADIHLLHALGGPRWFDLHFIANVSAGTPELYVRTRPRQTERTFEKVVKNLSLFRDLRAASGGGAHVTIMCVVNRLNCGHLLEVVKLARDVGAWQVWLKPMEIHGEVHRAYVPDDELTAAMARSYAEALAYADASGVVVFQREVCEEIIKKYSGVTVHV
jgi:wyosine [tRNA(Phe)-imidazoG37] synthetase (radical SAM superfamily)